jgi:predicted transcriptional regulator
MPALDHSLKVRLSRDERALLDRAAARERRTASAIVRFALIRYLLARESGDADALAPSDRPSSD